jgi:hypothetical protein
MGSTFGDLHGLVQQAQAKAEQFDNYDDYDELKVCIDWALAATDPDPNIRASSPSLVNRLATWASSRLEQD